MARYGRLPRLLDDQFNEVRRLHPSSLSATINLVPLSTATMSLPEGEPAIGFRSWVDLYAGNQSLGIFRTRGERPGTGPREGIILEHGLCTLGDSLTAEETTLTGTPKQILSSLLGYQLETYWVIGTAPETGSYSLEVDRTPVLQSVNDLVKLLPNYRVEADQRSVPWTISIVKMPETPTCECRLTRNMENVSISRDDSELYTIVYASALENGYMEADTASEYGYIAYDLGLAEDADRQKATDYANSFLNEHKSPRYSIEISAVDLSTQTGEPMDAFEEGKLCRVALPDWGVTVNERVISKEYSDPQNAPEKVRLTLSTSARDTSRWMADIRRNVHDTAIRSVRNSSGIGNNKSLILKNYDEILLNTKYISENNDLIQRTGLRLAQAEADLYATQEELSYAQNDLITAKQTISEVEVNLNAAQAEILQKASIEELEYVQGTTEILRNDLSEAFIRINGAEAEIEAKVEKNGVIAAINLSTEEAKIKAPKINLVGYVTASQLSAEIATLEGAWADNFATNNISAQYGYIVNPILINQTCAWHNLTMGNVASGKLMGVSGGSNINLQHSHKVTANDDGTVTLGEVSSSGGSFNMADTTFYKDAVSAAERRGYNSGYSAGNADVTISADGWSYGHNVVRASNNKQLTISLPEFTTSESAWTNDYKKTVYVKTDDETIAYRTVDASSIHRSAYDSGYNTVTMSVGSWSGNKVVVTASNRKTVTVDATGVYEDGWSDGWGEGRNSGLKEGRDEIKADVKKNSSVSFEAHSLTGSTGRYTLTYSVWASYDGSTIASARRKTVTLSLSS